VLLDCPPGLTETSEQVMRAADLIVVPVMPSPLSMRALAEVEAISASAAARCR
jgi:chromosome partitioning protein